MKRFYSRPGISVDRIEQYHALLQGSRVYTDDPQSTDEALSRRHDNYSVWDDDGSECND